MVRKKTRRQKRRQLFREYERLSIEDARLSLKESRILQGMTKECFKRSKSREKNLGYIS